MPRFPITLDRMHAYSSQNHVYLSPPPRHIHHLFHVLKWKNGDGMSTAYLPVGDRARRAPRVSLTPFPPFLPSPSPIFPHFCTRLDLADGTQLG